MTIEADLSRDESIDDIVGQARRRFGAIDILVNNAGVGQATMRPDNWQQPMRFWDITAEQWQLLCRGAHDGAAAAGARRRPRHDARANGAASSMSRRASAR